MVRHTVIKMVTMPLLLYPLVNMDHNPFATGDTDDTLIGGDVKASDAAPPKYTEDYSDRKSLSFTKE